MVYHFLPMPLLMFIHKGTRNEPHSNIERKFYPPMWIIWLLGIAYSILPLRLETMWFYVGFPIAMVGLIAYTLVIITFAATPVDSEPLTKELYRYSRHPMYITQLLMFIGVGIASASWLFLLFAIVYTIFSFIAAVPEERYCLEKYGDTYR